MHCLLEIIEKDDGRIVWIRGQRISPTSSDVPMESRDPGKQKTGRAQKLIEDTCGSFYQRSLSCEDPGDTRVHVKHVTARMGL
jgi:hypothetical protein